METSVLPAGMTDNVRNSEISASSGSANAAA